MLEEKCVCTKNFQPARLSQMLLFRKENKTKKADKAKKDPDKPKRPLSAYFIWMTEVKGFSSILYFNICFFWKNRQSIVEEVGTKDVKTVTKAAGEKWNSLTDNDKKHFEVKYHRSYIPRENSNEISAKLKVGFLF